MKDYMVVHFDGNNTQLTYTDTEEDARAYLAALITTNQVKASDTLSIVRVFDDYLIYYKRRNNTLKSVLGKKQASLLPGTTTWLGTLREVCARLYRKLANVSLASEGR
ncbi:hypothetical protein ACO2Q8_03890 [Larkinella sp. VNQ87]|uniref:hypothetical protein n=1 Tax=Larkinella sp. VNQ87 TaxID=3400921 RepID=UPI003C105226